MNEQIRKEIISLINSIQPFDTGCKATMNVIEGMVNQTFSKYKHIQKENEEMCGKIIIKIEWYLNHLKNTNSVYDQKEIASYIQNMLIDFSKKGNDLPDFQKAWEEFKNTVAYDDGESSETYGEMCSDAIKEIEEKFHLGGNKNE